MCGGGVDEDDMAGGCVVKVRMRMIWREGVDEIVFVECVDNVDMAGGCGGVWHSSTKL